MKLALDEAMKAYDKKEIPIGAIIVKDGRIIGRGYNQCESLMDPTAHAEMIALTSAANTLGDWRLKDCSIYVTKEPCPMCAGLLVHSRINRLIFSSKDLKTGAAGSAFSLLNHEKHNHQVQVKSGLLAAECSDMLSAFFKRRREEKKAEKLARKKQARFKR